MRISKHRKFGRYEKKYKAHRPKQMRRFQFKKKRYQRYKVGK